jgi:hypothetical protein
MIGQKTINPKNLPIIKRLRSISDKMNKVAEALQAQLEEKKAFLKVVQNGSVESSESRGHSAGGDSRDSDSRE